MDSEKATTAEAVKQMLSDIDSGKKTRDPVIEENHAAGREEISGKQPWETPRPVSHLGLAKDLPGNPAEEAVA